MLLSVNFHYIRDHGPGRAIFPATPAEFESQLEVLGRSFEFVGLSDLVEAVHGRRTLPPRACLITFDDGLAEQFEQTRDPLRRLGVPAVFFVAGAPLDAGRPLAVHLIHALREVVDDEPLLERIVASGVDVDVQSNALWKSAAEMYRYDTPVAALVKYVLNVVLTPQRRQALVTQLFSEFCEEPADFVARTYMTPEHIATLEREDSLGAHGYDHLPLAQLSPASMRADLRKGAAALRRVTGANPKMLSYPYGSRATVDTVVAEAAVAEGFEVGLTMERAFNTSLEDPLLLARIDSRDAPGGRDPLFSVQDGEIVCGDRISETRRRYLAEAVAV